MAKFSENPGQKFWLKGLCGYLAVLLAGVGLVYYWRVAYRFGEGIPHFALYATLAVLALLSVVYLAAMLAARFLRHRPALLAAALIALAGLLFAFANPPLQAPDESDHFVRAYAIGSGNFRFEQYEDYPDDVDTLWKYFDGPVAHTQEGGLLGGYRRYLAEADQEQGLHLANTLRQQIVIYLPQAAGVALGRLFGGRAMACMYVARCVNALCYAAACGLALHLAARFRALLLAVMLCPSALYIAASCNQDGLYMGLLWIFIGACLSDGVDEKRLALLSVCFALAFYAKYTTLALLPLLALAEWRPARRGAPEHRAARLGIMAGVCLLTTLLLYWAQASYVSWASDYSGLTYFDPNIAPAQQLRFIFANLPRYAAVLCYTLYRDVLCLFYMGHFGQLDVIVPAIDCLSPLLLLFAAGCAARECAHEPARTGWTMGASAVLLYGFTYTGMYLTCTPVTMPVINGVQTRYLLQAFFAMLVLIAMLLGRAMALHKLPAPQPQETAAATRLVRGVCFVYGVGCALLLFQRYYIGI